MGEIKDKGAEVYRDSVVAGVPASGSNEPAKSAIRALFSAVDLAIGAASAGIQIVSTTADRDTFYATEANRGKLVYVNNNNGSATDPANGVYEYVGGAPRLAESFYEGLATVVQPLVDQATAAAASANTSKIAAQTAAAAFPPIAAAAYRLKLGRGGGAVWDLSLWRTMLFQDAAGTIPVTATGQPVGCIRNVLGDPSYDYIAQTNSERPTFQIEDGIALVRCGNSQGLITRAVHDVTAPFYMLGALDRSSDVGRFRMMLHSRNVMFHALVAYELGAYAVYNNAGGADKYIDTPFYTSRLGQVAVIDTLVKAGKADVRLNGGTQVAGRSPQSIALTDGTVVPTALITLNMSEQALAGQAAANVNTSNTVDFYGGCFVAGDVSQETRDWLVGYFRSQAEPQRRTGDKVILIDGDSTGDDVNEQTSQVGSEMFDRWASETTAGYLRALNPNDTIYYCGYSKPGQQYTGWKRTQLGTSGRRIFVVNTSVAGSQPCYHLAARFPSVFGRFPQIDEIITNHGQNMAAGFYASLPTEAGKYLRVGEWTDYFDKLRTAYPTTPHLAIRTHPNGTTGDQSILPVVQAFDIVTATYGDIRVADIYAYFEANNRPPAWYKNDKVHVSEPDGVSAQLTVFAPAYANWTRPAVVAPARIGRSTANLLTNGRFDDFDGALPNGWTKEGSGTVTRSTEQVDTVLGDNYSVKLDGIVNLVQSIDATPYRGQQVTVAVRQYVAGGTSADRGLLRLFTNGTGAINEGISGYSSSGQPLNGWRWVYHTALVPSDATTITFKPFGAASDTGTVFYGRAVMSAGPRPKDQR